MAVLPYETDRQIDRDWDIDTVGMTERERVRDKRPDRQLDRQTERARNKGIYDKQIQKMKGDSSAQTE